MLDKQIGKREHAEKELDEAKVQLSSVERQLHKTELQLKQNGLEEQEIDKLLTQA